MSCALSIHQKECQKSLGCALSIEKYGNLFFFYLQAEECEEIYVAVREYKYPVYVDNRTNEEKILHEAEYYIRMLANKEKYWNDMSIQIPLKRIMPYVPMSDSLSVLR